MLHISSSLEQLMEMLFIAFSANMAQHALMSNNNQFELEEPELLIYNKKNLDDAYFRLWF